MAVLIKTKQLEPESEGTRILLKFMNSLFDLLNNCDASKGLRSEGKERDKLIFYLNLLNNFSFATSTPIPCINNLKISIRCFLSYQLFLEQNFKLEYILTRHYNQDCIENLFSIIRYEADENGSLRPEVFKKVFSSLLFSNFVRYKSIENKNCLDDENIFLSLVKKDHKIKESVEDKPSDNISITELDYLDSKFLELNDDNIDRNYLTLNVSSYIAGFLLKKMDFICKECFFKLSSSDKNQPGLEFIGAKERPGQNLYSPSYLFSNFVKMFSDFFDFNIDDMWYLKDLRKIFCEKFLSEVGHIFEQFCCNEKIAIFCTGMLFRILTTHYLKKRNEKFSDDLLKKKQFLINKKY